MPQLCFLISNVCDGGAAHVGVVNPSQLTFNTAEGKGRTSLNVVTE